MKRFWVFVIICVVALGIGFTVFRFMSKDEVLYVNQTVFEVNSGENIKLGIVAENLKSGTTVSAMSNNDSVVEKVGDFEFKAKNGGTTTITVSSNKKDFVPVTVQVTVGDGLLATPFFIKNAADLAKIGTEKVEGGQSLKYPLSSNYKLTASFALPGDSWNAIAKNDNAGFTGTFDFNGHEITNLNVTDGTYAGLFAKIGLGGIVRNAKLSGISLSANAEYSGALACINFGRIENAEITNITITNGATNAYVGGLVGLNNGVITKSYVNNSGFSSRAITATGEGSVVGGIAGASILENLDSTVSISRSYAKVSVTGVKAVGGIVGQNTASIVENCYAGSLAEDFLISGGSSTNAGGIAGLVDFKQFNSSTQIISYVGDSYSVMKFNPSNSSATGAIIGKNDNYNSGINYNIFFGNYYSTETNSGINGIGLDAQPAAIENVGVYGKTTQELKAQATYFSFFDKKSGAAMNWQFAEGVWTIVEGSTLPELSFTINYVTSRVQNYATENSIDNSNFVDKLTSGNNQIVYTLNENIVLKSEDGYSPIDFNGKLTCPLNENGEPLYTITLIINTPEGVNDGAVAVFRTLGQNAQLTNIKVIVTVRDILESNHVAAIAAYNNGNIDNCSAIGTITTDATSGTIYLAGLVAENNGNIANSISSVSVTYEKSPTLVYVGGVSAYSTGSITNSRNNGGLTINGRTTMYVGGVAGYASGAIVKSSNHGVIMGNVEASNAYFGGITAYLAQTADAKMTYCGSHAEIHGSNVGGLVGISMGAIENCYSSASLSGHYVGGLAYNIKQGTEQNRSYIKNSMTDNSMLTGEKSTSIVCGAVYQIDVSEAHLAYCEKIFTSAKFTGDGQKYYETISNIRGGNKTGQSVYSYIDADAFNNSIHVERTGDIERSTADFSWSWDNWFQWDMVRKGKTDIQISEEVAKGSEGFAVFTDNNYSTSIWNFVAGSYPTISGVAE